MKKSIFTIVLLLVTVLASANENPCLTINPNSTIIKVDVKRVVKIQRGVSNSKANGVYIYYVMPNDAKFNPAVHRKFISTSEYKLLFK